MNSFFGSAPEKPVRKQRATRPIFWMLSATMNECVLSTSGSMLTAGLSLPPTPDYAAC
jgi:hypothetical protein